MSLDGGTQVLPSLDACPALVLNADYRPLSYFPLSTWHWQETIKAIFTANKPVIEKLDSLMFKYRVDFDHLDIERDIGAVCVSRPTNPTGNVVTDNELKKLGRLTAETGVPLIVDGAYGLPFPNMLFTGATPHWNENTILALSLSKLGMPGIRTGIIVAREDIIEAYAGANGIINLACGNMGPAIVQEMFRSGEIAPCST